MKNRAFTLIELLMVVSIISLLSSIVMSSLTESRQKARDVAKIQTLSEVKKALDLFMTAKDYYPTTGDFKNSLTTGNPVYINNIDEKVIYRGVNQNNTECITGKCVSYHLGIVLERTDNPALRIDVDSTKVFSGMSSNCTNFETAIDKCYDIEPNI